MVYSSWHGPILEEDGKRDAWNGVLQVLRLRWLNLTTHHPERARLVLPEQHWRKEPFSYITPLPQSSSSAEGRHHALEQRVVRLSKHRRKNGASQV